MMSHAEKCPVCLGTGNTAYYGLSTTIKEPFWKKCHGCNGTGWVTVRDFLELETTPPQAERK